MAFSKTAKLRVLFAALMAIALCANSRGAERELSCFAGLTADELKSDIWKDFSAEYEYNALAAPTMVKRYGINNITLSAQGAAVEQFGTLDELTYDWNGALLEGVTAEAHGTDFYGRTGYAGSATGKNAAITWTEAGLLKSDSSRGITNITYNRRGQPLRVSFRNGTAVEHQYDCHGLLERVTALGRTSGKLGQQLVTGTRAYAGEFVFRNDTLSMISFSGGYFDSEGKPHYQHTDWQGSVTLVSSHDGKVVQHTGYYPYGEPWREPSGQPYLFGGKERMRDGSLYEYDFSARRLYSALAIWTAPDPLAGKYTNINPYCYCASNPVRYIDPSGMEFTEGSEKYLSKFVTSVQKRIDDINKDIAQKQIELSTEVKNQAKIEKKITELENKRALYMEVLDEIEVLKNSNQVYNIYKDSKYCIPSDPRTGEGGVARSGFMFNSKTLQFDIILCYYDERFMSHELKHAYQFEIGELSSGHSPDGQPFYDRTDEVEAYKRGALFGQRNYIENYKLLQEGPRSSTIYVQMSGHDSFLQKIANDGKCAFRYNGRTYVGKDMKTK